MSRLPDEELAELARLAKDATPGPYRAESDWAYEVMSAHGTLVGKFPLGPDADLFAAAHPGTVAALVEEVRELRAWKAFAESENLAFNVKAAKVINEARAEAQRLQRELVKLRVLLHGALSKLACGEGHPLRYKITKALEEPSGD